MVNCVVKFDNNPNGVYYSGQTLSGIVEVTSEKARKYRLVLKIEGFAKCNWTESEGSGKHRRSVSYSGREDYISTTSYLVGNYNGNGELPAGLHKFNFSCFLPLNIPTSFESKYGHIRYQVKIILERSWKFDLKYCFGFTVIKVSNLNYESPVLRSPLKVELTKNFFFGLSSKSLHVSTNIPFRGFVAGQTVSIDISVNNESSVDVKEMKISLKKFIHYNSQMPRAKTRERIESAAEIRHAGVLGKQKNDFVVKLNLPSVPPTNITCCSVIKVFYEIHVVAKVGGMHWSPVLRIPVTIGTVPLRDFQYNYSLNVSYSNGNVEPSTSSLAPSAPLGYYSQSHESSAPEQDLPPPSYQVAMGMISNEADNDEGLTEEKAFSPLYPVFNFESMAASKHNSAQNAPPPNYEYITSQLSYGEKKNSQ